MKRVFRILGFCILIPLMTYWIYLGVFQIHEYFVGNIYVSYLNKNKTVMDEDFVLDDSFYEKQFYMVGELHGFAKSPEIDFKLFKHLNQKTGVRYYMSEVDYSQAYFLNKYLETGQDSLISFSLKNWLVIQAQENKDYYEKWKKLYNYNRTLPEDKKIKILGCDVLTDVEVVRHHIMELVGQSDFNLLFGSSKKLDAIVDAAKRIMSNPNRRETLALKYGPDFKNFEHLMNTILQTEERVREAKIFENFKSLYSILELEKEKIFAFYGFFHVLQEKPANGFPYLAARIKGSNLTHGKNMVSMTMCFQDSEMIMPSAGLPSLLQTGPVWSEVGFKYDSLLLFYLKGIMDLKRTSEPNTTTIYKINQPDSPYFKTDRLMEVNMILPILENQKIEIPKDKHTADYAQYLIFVRNSRAAKPIDK